MNLVLLVDDDPVVLRVLVKRFTRAGWETRTARTAGEALIDMLAFPPRVIVTDLDMDPGEEPAGVRVLRSARTFWPDVGVILYTGTGALEERGAFDAHVEKPNSSGDVVRQCERFRHGRRAALSRASD